MTASKAANIIRILSVHGRHDLRFLESIAEKVKR